MINNVATGQTISVAGGVNNGTAIFGAPVAFSSGDVIGFRTVTAGGATDARVAAMVESDLP